MQFLEKNGMILLPHPPYSPDLAPSHIKHIKAKISKSL
uniref:Tc1-like transposase DDE domain-containing protein n=1 Tax=Salarias fasciatus TaxID=181472 RepID=A0A672ID90_SALFA